MLPLSRMQAESLQLLQAIDDGIEGVFDGVQARTFAAGEELVAEGASLDRLLLVSSGVCQVSWQGLPESQRPCLGAARSRASGWRRGTTAMGFCWPRSRPSSCASVFLTKS